MAIRSLMSRQQQPLVACTTIKSFIPKVLWLLLRLSTKFCALHHMAQFGCYAGEEHSAMIHQNQYVVDNSTRSLYVASPREPPIIVARYNPPPITYHDDEDDDDDDDEGYMARKRYSEMTAHQRVEHEHRLSSSIASSLPYQTNNNNIATDNVSMPVLVANRASDDVTLEMKDLLERLVANQDRRIRPNFGREPVPVGVTVHISTISSINEVEMDYTLDFYFRQYWEDPRLRFHAPFLKGKVVSVGADFLSRIWVPDTFFPNEKSSFFHTATTTNKFVRISPSGQLEVSVRLTVTAACPMNLTYFPMDRQRCTLQIESYGYGTRDIIYYWKPQSPKPSAEVDPNMELPQFEVWPKGGCRNLTIHYVLSTGNYSRLVCEFLFQRTMGYYLIQIYIPASLIVIISWVSFWLSRDSTPSRVTLGVTVVLAMTTLMSGTTASLPKVSYVKSIDVYLGTCFVMVFSSLLEYAAVGYTAKRMKMRRARQRLRSHLARGLFAAGSIGLPMQATVQAINEHGMGGGGREGNVFAMLNERDRRESFAVQVDAEGNVISADEYEYGNQMMRDQCEQDAQRHLRPRRWQALFDRANAAVAGPPPALQLETDPFLPYKTAGRNIKEQVASPYTQYASDAFTLPLAERLSSSVSFVKDKLTSGNPAPGTTAGLHTPSPQTLLKSCSPAQHKTASQFDDQMQPPLFMYDGAHGAHRRGEFNPSDIDKYSRIVFPLAFVAFNIVYWFSYLHVANMVDKEMMYSIPSG